MREISFVLALLLSAVVVSAEEVVGHIMKIAPDEILVMDNNDGHTTKIAIPDGSKLAEGLKMHQQVVVTVKDKVATEIKKVEASEDDSDQHQGHGH